MSEIGLRSQAPVAQRIEQQPSNLSVVGSIPTGGATDSGGVPSRPEDRALAERSGALNVRLELTDDPAGVFS